MELDDKLCFCFHVSKRKIVNYLRMRQPSVPSQLSECGGAGTGCGWCIPYLKKYFQEMKQQGNIAEEQISSAEYAKERADYVRAGKGTPPPNATPLPDSDEAQP